MHQAHLRSFVLSRVIYSFTGNVQPRSYSKQTLCLDIWHFAVSTDSNIETKVT